MHRLKLVPYSKQTTTIYPIIVHACIKIMLSLHFWYECIRLVSNVESNKEVASRPIWS